MALTISRSNISLSTYSPEDLSRLIEMAWEDRTPFEAIENLYGLNQHLLIELMRKELKRGSFKLHGGRRLGVRSAYQVKQKISSDRQRGQTAMESPACNGECEQLVLGTELINTS